MANYDITALGTPTSFSNVSVEGIGLEKLTDTRFIAVWRDGGGAGFQIQTFELNTSTGAITANGSAASFLAAEQSPAVCVIDSTNVLVAGRDGNDDAGYARLFSINSGTGAVTANGAAVEFDNTEGSEPALVLLDATHVLCAFTGTISDNALAQVFTVNTGTGSVSLEGSPTTVATDKNSSYSLAKISTSKVVMFWGNSTNNDAYMQVLDINTSSWAVSTAGTRTTVDNEGSNEFPQSCSITIISTSPLVVAVSWFVFGGGNQMNARTYSINETTWAITAFGSQVSLDPPTNAGFVKRTISKVDEEAVLLFYSGTNDDGFATTFSYNSSTGALTALDELEFDTGNAQQLGSVEMDTGLFVTGWYNSDDTDAYLQSFSIEVPSDAAAPAIFFGANF